jgi:hypothetical protein
MTQHDRPGETINPFASPPSSIAQVAIDTGEAPLIADLRALVGPNADYYLKKWAPLLQSARNTAGANWAAFFLSGFWLPYRKMYKLALVFYAFIIGESIAEEVVFISILGQPETPEWLNRVVGLVISIVCAAFGNQWYLSHAQRVISETRAEGLEGEALRERLSKRGGTSLWASLGMFALFVLMLGLVFAFFDAV